MKDPGFIIGLIFIIIGIAFLTICLFKRKEIALSMAKQYKKIYKFDYDDKTIKRIIIVNTIGGIFGLLFCFFVLIFIILNAIGR